jgi:hypothetical protein
MTKLSSEEFFVPKDANLDHIVPIAAGGDHVMSNVQV